MSLPIVLIPQVVSWVPCSTLSTHTTMCPLTAPLLLSNLLIILWFWASFSIKLDLEFGHRKCTDKVHLGVVWKRLQSGLNALQRYNNNNNCLFVTYTIIQSIASSEICALHLTNPSWSPPPPPRLSCGLNWAHLRVCSPLSAGHLPQTLQKQSC